MDAQKKARAIRNLLSKCDKETMIEVIVESPLPFMEDIAVGMATREESRQVKAGNMAMAEYKRLSALPEVKGKAKRRAVNEATTKALHEAVIHSKRLRALNQAFIKYHAVYKTAEGGEMLEESKERHQEQKQGTVAYEPMLQEHGD